MKSTYLFLLLFFSILPGYAQEVFQNRIIDKDVQTLQVRIAGEQISDSYIPLNGDKVIEVNFDVLDPQIRRYAYTLTHCDADWKQSMLSPIEYMDGFQGITVDDFANGMGTTTAYTNYRFEIPNRDIQLKVSGNYAIRVYDEDTPDKTAFWACFSVVEPKVTVDASATGNTLIDTNRSHQQINFSINTTKFPISYPQSDLKIWVYQNNRRDNAVTGIMPTSISNSRIEYANMRELIFKAGNEYRRFEFLSNRYNGMHVNNISFHNPYYHVELQQDRPRRNGYVYDQDQNGRFFIACSGSNDPDTEADYYLVHFTLKSDFYTDGQVYIGGELFQNIYNERSRMNYNRETGCYEKSLLLKQGNYNFRYLFLPEGETQALTELMEGDYFQTENEYIIYIYYRPMGERYDHLIGVKTLQTNFF